MDSCYFSCTQVFGIAQAVVGRHGFPSVQVKGVTDSRGGSRELLSYRFVIGTNGSGELVWLNRGQIVASYTQELEEQVASLQEQLQLQQEELLAIVQSQQEQIAQLQRMMGEQFASR